MLDNELMTGLLYIRRSNLCLLNISIRFPTSHPTPKYFLMPGTNGLNNKVHLTLPKP